MSLHLLDSFTFIKHHTPYSFHNLHFISDTNIDIGLFREIGQNKMGIYKSIYHPHHLHLQVHSLSELSIGRPSKDVISQQDPLHLIPTRWTMLGQLPQMTQTLHPGRSHWWTFL